MQNRSALRARRFVLAAMLAGAAVAVAGEPVKPPAAPLPPLGRASWIWGDAEASICQFRIGFSLADAPSAAAVLITADNGYELYVNGTRVGADVGAEGEVWQTVERYDITARLARGHNAIGIRGIDLGGLRGLIAALRVDIKDKPSLELVTDERWHVTAKGDPVDYAHPEFIEGPQWSPARIVGPMGMAPWGNVAWSADAPKRVPRGVFQNPIVLDAPTADFRWPETIAFIADDCSVYVPLRGDAWGVAFRVNEWSRAYTEFDLPCPSKIGRKLYLLSPSGETPRLLVDAGQGVMGSPSVTYDGRWILLAMAAEGESFFHVYRVPVEGGEPERLTDGPYHDIDPAELPDGRIVFTSTRIGSFEEYHCPPARSLYVMNGDGSRIEPITFTPIFDNEPKVMADGRIAFVRTDNFFDRGKVETQIHVIRPDGTSGQTEIGADVGAQYGSRLRAFGYGSPAPLPDGRLACISNRGNFIASVGTAEKTFQRLPTGLGDLAALPDGRLLATVLRPGERRMESDVIAVIDHEENRFVTIYESTLGSVHSPVFVGPRPRPPVVPEHITRKHALGQPATGTLYCQNVRFTTKTKADWPQVRAIRVLGAMALTTRSSHSHIVHVGHETVELGTVPLAPDGSFYAEVPADMPIALQAVDAEGRSELNEMSWIYVRPGERRSCVGCHAPRSAASPADTRISQSLEARPLKVVGQGRAHRFRGNNAGVTGLMDLQFERYRETASLNLHSDEATDPADGRAEVAALLAQFGSDSSALRISAAQRLAIFRDRAAALALADRLGDDNREVCVASALALAACGTRESTGPLLDALTAPDPLLAQAAAVALGNLTGEARPFNAFAPLGQRRLQAEAWRTWLASTGWEQIERTLIERAFGADPAARRQAVVAMGHIAGAEGKAALRRWVGDEAAKNPYPVFEKDNRTDHFTFAADSPLNPRTLQEATRALGYLGDAEAVPMLTAIVQGNVDPRTGNMFLAEAACESLGRIGTPEAETALLETFAALQDYWHYVGWYSDHPALYACHASPLHARVIAALDRIGSTKTASIVPQLIRSTPTDPDRALFPKNDAYETLVGRLIRRSGRADEVIETCLAALGDKGAASSEDVSKALAAAFPAWAGTPVADNRASQVLSFVCRDARYEPRIRAAYDAYRARPEDAINRPLGNPTWIPQRHWVLFYLGRALGNLGQPASVDTLLASLASNLNEARHGRPDPAEPNIHFLHLEYTPCWRATAAWALGRTGDRRAVPTLLEATGNLDNATDVRHAAAGALERLADPHSRDALERLTEDYPEYCTLRALQRAAAAARGTPPSIMIE
jgi:HEAT repeat protein